MKKIGDGSFGHVYLRNGRAIKRCFYSTIKPVWMLNLREMDIMQRMKGHPYMVNLEKVNIVEPIDDIGKDQYGEPIPVVMEKLELEMECVPMTLQNYIPKGEGLSLDEVRKIMAQILVAIEYMHINRIIHRDLKPDNVLYDEQTEKVSICDFGMCDIEMKYSCPELNVTGFIYRAPEIFCKRRYSKEIDLWAAGCIMYYLITGYPLFRVKDDLIPHPEMFKLQKEITSKKLFKDNHDFREVFEGLVKIDPRERISATQALSKRFFDPVRAELIDPVRKKYPPIGIELEEVVLDYLPERRWIKEIIQNFLKNNRQEDLCIFPVIFHGLEIFERYLSWAKDNQVSLPPSHKSDSGRYLTKDETILHLYTCLYIAHKYYAVVDPVWQWDQFFPEGYRTPEHGAYAEKFEEIIVTEICKYSIFKLTIYEHAEDYWEAPTDKEYLQILNIYLNIPAWKNGSYRKMFRDLMMSKLSSS